MQSNHKITLIGFLFVLILFGLYDIGVDLGSGVALDHIIFEILFTLVSASLVFIIWRYIEVRESGFKRAREELSRELSHWQDSTQKLRQTLRQEIEHQFQSWGLSKAETTVAFLIIRGFSFTQIAALLNKSERTVRQQSVSIYQKTGFAGRAEFTAFFLESIFELGDEESFYD